MKPLSKKKITVIVLSSVLGVFLLYALICCAVTFIPISRQDAVDLATYGEGKDPSETILLSNDVKLYAFPEGNVRDKCVIVCPGGGYENCNVGTEGFTVAAELNRLGYPAFVLEYRTGERITTSKAPLDDLANAIRYIDEHARQYNISKGHYVLCGFSAGGHLAGLFATKEHGYALYEGINAPDALLLAYPACCPSPTYFNGNIADYGYYNSLNGKLIQNFMLGKQSSSDLNVALSVDKDYPRTYIMQGDKDDVTPAKAHSGLLIKALKKNNVDRFYRLGKGVKHGCGLGIGTSVEGWLSEAMRFTYEKWYEEEYAADPYTVEEVKAKTGGFMCGVCHPNERFEQMTELGSDWVRFDITSLPFDKDGNLTTGYLQFKEYAKTYVDRGFKVFAVTPMPGVYVDAGFDPRIKENELAIMEQIRFLTTDLQGLVSAFQVMNEQTEMIFRAPLTMEESASFTALTLKVMNRFKGNTVVGYNLSANDFSTYLDYMDKYNQYSDYIGVDIYLGCFESMTHNLGFFPASGWIWLIKQTTGRPVIMTEFGYISEGAPKSSEEKLSILQQYGAQGNTLSEAEKWAKANIAEFINNENFPSGLRNYLRAQFSTEEDIASALFGGPNVLVDYSSHLYRALGEDINLKNYPHTPQGQAEFFTDYFEDVVYSCDYLCGAILYCLNDAEACGYCGQSDCPVETRWGLLTVDGEKKPSFYAVKDAFAKCKKN